MTNATHQSVSREVDARLGFQPGRTGGWILPITVCARGEGSSLSELEIAVLGQARMGTKDVQLSCPGAYLPIGFLTRLVNISPSEQEIAVLR